MPRKDTEIHTRTTETERTETVRHIGRRITIHGARDLADAQRILAEHGITDVDLSSIDDTRRPRGDR